jgi:hypothetical protein
MKIKHRYMSPDGDGGAPPINDVPPPATIINEPPAGDPPPSPPVGEPPAEPPKAFYESMPEDWRNQIVDSLGIEDQAEKDKRLGQLNRFSDIKSMSKTLFESQDKIRSGQIETGLPENATGEQLKDYREANGIPESAEGYAEFLDEGLVLGEADQRIMDGVYQTALDNNVPASTVNQLTSAMMAARQTEQDGIVAQDGVDQQQTERMAKEMWGGDYQANINMISGHLNKLPAELKESFINGRLSDGKAIMNSPEILSFLSDAARLANPAGTVVPNSSNPGQSIKDEIKTLESKMGTDGWYKDKDAQARYQQLVDAQESM